MREDFEVEIGAAGTLRVQAIVRHRDSDATRNSSVVVRDDHSGDRLRLTCREAAALHGLLGCGGFDDRNDHPIDEIFRAEGSDDAPEIRVVANDDRIGALTIVRQYSPRVRELLHRATEAISMVERLDALSETAEP
jgi:hypothetical protein